MSELSPLSGEERKLDFGAVRSVEDPNLTSPRLSFGSQAASPCQPIFAGLLFPLSKIIKSGRTIRTQGGRHAHKT
jgi:hypothetical protein